MKQRLAQHKRILIVMVLLAIVLVSAMPTFAQTATPIPPTATAVTIVVSTDDIFNQTNNWISIFTPIVAIGVGIAIALAILTFIGSQILKAFRSSGR